MNHINPFAKWFIFVKVFCKDIFILAYKIFWLLTSCDMNQKQKSVSCMKHRVISHMLLNRRLPFNIFPAYTNYKLLKKRYVYRYNYIYDYMLDDLHLKRRISCSYLK